MNNLLARIITAVIGVSILIAAIVNNYWTFALVFFAIMFMSLIEFFQLTKNSGKRPFTAWGLVVGTLLFALLFLQAKTGLERHYFLLLPATISFLFILALFRKNKDNIVTNISFSVFGTIYVSLPLSLMSSIAFIHDEYHYGLVLGILFSQWAADTGAYFAGKSLGKHKLYEAISPNKTWEGSIGGFLLSLVVAYVFSLYFPALNTVEWLGLGAIISIFGTMGDLVESFFKRALAIKDSGSILPGHGGFLDRFDGLLLSLPFATLYIYLVI